MGSQWKFLQKCSIIIHHLKRAPLIRGFTCNARLFQAAIIGKVTCKVYEYHENYEMTSPHLSICHLGPYMSTIDVINMTYDLRVFTNDTNQLPVAYMALHLSKNISPPPCKSTSPGGNLNVWKTYITPLKSNVDTKNGDILKEIHFPNHHFWYLC